MFVAVLQARMSSRRLPGKAVAPLAGEPMIWRQIERLRRSRRLSRVMVATSTENTDDALTGYLVSRGQSVFRGDAIDLLGRFARCAESLGSATHIVRAKGDCPFVDPMMIDEAIRVAQSSGADYVSNCKPSLYPAGMEVEVITTEALLRAGRPNLADRLYPQSPEAVLVGPNDGAVARSFGLELAREDRRRPGLRQGGVRRPARRRSGLWSGRGARSGRKPPGSGALRSLDRRYAVLTPTEGTKP